MKMISVKILERFWGALMRLRVLSRLLAFVFISGIVFFSVAPLHAARCPINAQSLKSAVSLKIKIAKETFEVGEDIIVEFIFQNDSRKTAVLLLPFYPGFRSLDTDIERIAYCGDQACGINEMPLLVRIPPRRSHAINVPLHEYRIMWADGRRPQLAGEKAGVFSVAGVYASPVGFDIATTSREFLVDRIESAPLVVDVREPADRILSPDEAGNFHLEIINLSASLPVAPLEVRIDGKLAARGEFKVSSLEGEEELSYQTFTFFLDNGFHRMTVESLNSQDRFDQEFLIDQPTRGVLEFVDKKKPGNGESDGRAFYFSINPETEI